MTNKERKRNFFYLTHSKGENKWHVKEFRRARAKNLDSKEENIFVAEELARKRRADRAFNDEIAEFAAFECF